jgi:hypothetical protein
MTLSDFRRISDEMLSAYIDGEVTEQERALIEAAIAADEEVAWRLNSLRQTVNLLHDLPELALPRSFTLSADQARMAQAEWEPMGVVAGVGATEQPPALSPRALPNVAPKEAPQIETIPGFWEQVQRGWQGFWQAGNPMLRNAAAVSFALLLVLAGSGQILTRALTQPAGMTASAPAAAPASDEAAAPAAEMVALAPTETVQEPLLSQAAPAANKAATESDTTRQAFSVEDTTTEAPTAEAAAAPAGESAESPVVEEEPEAEAADESAMVVEAEAATPESAPAEAAAVASDTQPPPPAEAAAPEEEPQAGMAMAAPEQPLPESQDSGGPPMEEAPFPGAPAAREQSGGGGAGMGGGGGEGPAMELAPGVSAPDSGFPPEAQGFEVDPMAQAAAIPTEIPAEEAVSASVAAAPAEEAAEESAADMVATPAVEAVIVESATVESATTESDVAQEDSTEESSDAARMAATASPASTATASENTTDSAVTEPTVEPTTAPTAEAVAVVAPEPITSSDVVENAPTEGPGIVTGSASNLPVVWIAQGSVLLLTVLLTTLWWRSRTPRRPR